MDPRWAVLGWLRDYSAHRRQRICTTRGVLPVGTVRRSDSGVSVGGVMVCGSRNCPMCGPRLYARNRDDIRQCVRAWTEGYGGAVLLGTFTAGHTLGDTLADSLAITSKAWGRVTGGKGWLTARRRFGIHHWVRVFEEKFSDETGWHSHVHYLLFLEKASDDIARELLLDLFRSWSSAVKSAGRSVSVRAQDLRVVRGVDSDRVLGEYFTKQMDASSSQSSDRIALEMSGRDTKFGGGSLTPAEVLLLAVAVGEQWAGLWREFELATHKRRVIAFSRGLRDFAGVGDEVPDAEVSAQSADAEGTVELLVRGKHLRDVLSRKNRATFVRVVFEQGGPAAVVWLAERGLTGWLPELGEFAELDSAEFDPDVEGVPEFSGALPW